MLPQPLVFLINIVQPWLLLSISLFFIPVSLVRIVVTQDWESLTSLSRFKDVWFARVWLFGGPIVRAGARPRVAPLLEGRIRQGAVVPLNDPNNAGHTAVHGTVIEVGPGSGMWVGLFADRGAPSAGKEASDSGLTAGFKVEKVLGVEPNTSLHPALRQNVRAAGLEDRYEVVPVGIQDLGVTGKVAEDSVDAIVTLMCLCSIPDPEKNIRELYSYLKPGGKWYVYEHVTCFDQQGQGMKSYQKIINTLWLPLMGGCDLCRDTVQALKDAGPWSDVDLAHLKGEGWWVAAPHVIGTLTK